MMNKAEFNTDSKQKYEESIKTFIDEVDDEITSLQKKIDNVESVEKAKFNAQIEALKIKRDEFINKLRYIQKTEEFKWKENYRKFNDQMSKITDDIESTFKDIKNEFEHAMN